MDDVHPGDVVLVRPGEVVPADGVVAGESAVIDGSALTGEPLPVELRRGRTVRSGTANAGAAFDLRVTRPAAESAYAALVKLVREAERHRAPFVRLADRYAAIFLPVSPAVAGAAWAAGGDAKRGLELSFPTDASEGLGQGIEGAVDGRRVAVGSSAWLESHGYACAAAHAHTLDDGDGTGRAKVLVGVDGVLAGAIVMADHLRPDAAELVQRLRDAGIRHVALVTGDREEIAEEIGRQIGVDRVYSEHSPEDKLDVVRAMRENPLLRPVVMVGDGINDAPALALADVGIAMGFAGATVSSETADAVIVVDRIDRVVEAVRIGRRSLFIARQSVLAGIGLSLVAMVFAAFGYITPVWGALLQEGIDVAVILNALRALRG